MPVHVHKLGGSVLTDATAIRQAAAAVAATQLQSAIVVVSACAGVTDRLLSIGQRAAVGDVEEALDDAESLFAWHLEQAQQLLPYVEAEKFRQALERLQGQAVRLCQAIGALQELTARTQDALVAFGELLASQLVAKVLQTVASVPVRLVDAREYLITDAAFGQARPDVLQLQARCQQLIEYLADGAIVTQGFIGATPEGATTTLGRGGSDYSAALFAAALQAEELTVWKDVAGVYTADPDEIPEAELVPELSAAEMRELAFSGAKVLHPDALEPAIASGISVRVRSVLATELPGTVIRRCRHGDPMPVAMAWKMPCWLYAITAEQRSSLQDSAVLVAALSRSGGLVVTEAVVEDGRYGWQLLGGPQAMLSLIGPAPERWAAAMLEQLRQSGLPYRAWLADSALALRVFVPHEAWREAARTLHCELLRWQHSVGQQ
ncbi:MAG: aspartate kinase [Candidatus Kapabacteria bacterium]|nr:aspartate kinase [Candidatus Kapabacteria bacterium]MDW8012811.1 aspartate kinase [Bacteroidota bacterium]